MATVYKSKVSGEYGIQDDQGRFEWVSKEQAVECIAVGPAKDYCCEDGTAIKDNDPLWDNLVHVTNIE